MAIVRDGSWTDVSLDWIGRMRAQHSDLSAKELERLCRKSYPYEARRGWAYKAWLKAMRLSFRGGEITKNRAVARCKETIDMFENAP